MELPTLETKPQGESHVEKTEIGSYFVSNYPPFSVWSKEHVPAALKALETPQLRERLNALGVETWPGTAEQLQGHFLLLPDLPSLRAILDAIRVG